MVVVKVRTVLAVLVFLLYMDGKEVMSNTTTCDISLYRNVIFIILIDLISFLYIYFSKPFFSQGREYRDPRDRRGHYRGDSRDGRGPPPPHYGQPDPYGEPRWGRGNYYYGW